MNASTKDQPGAFDALEKAEPGEPMFPLLARDPAAPGAITEWCRLRRNRAVKLWGDSKRVADKKLLAAELDQCANAEEVALQFAEWREDRAPVEGERSGYQEVKRTVVELAEADVRKRQEASVRSMREAAYHLCEAKDALLALGLAPPATEHDLVMMLARINGLADAYTARRDAA